ncbi:MAG: response regulator [Candidatus Omnitrophica bacterium]|nr:response regulator [Candidatus Omnitrophota bacterium]
MLYFESMVKKNPKILVVDDEPDVIAHCQSYLGRKGYSVNTTASGVDAVSMIKTLKPDLIILDRSIPDMDGIDVLRALRQFDQETKVIILTGYSLDSEEDRQIFYDLGISKYIEKPVVLEELENTILMLLGGGYSVEGIKQKEVLRSRTASLRSIAHKMKNLLGNIRNECEIFLLNKKDGLYDDKTKEELEEMADEIIADVIETVDQAREVFNKINES